MATSSPQHPITVYTAGTPNGWKATVTLEVLGVKYNVHKIDFKAKEQKAPWYLKINPNGRIPAIVDHENDNFAVFESGALMLYLAEKHSGLLGSNDKERSEVVQWLMFQMAGVGPMQGQANHFVRYAPEQIEYAINRYKLETRRLYSVLENRLNDGNRDFLVGSSLSLADIANWSWVACAPYAQVDLKEFPALERWVWRLWEDERFKRGLEASGTTPDKFPLLMKEEDMSQTANKSKDWIQKTMVASDADDSKQDSSSPNGKVVEAKVQELESSNRVLIEAVAELSRKVDALEKKSNL